MKRYIVVFGLLVFSFSLVAASLPSEAVVFLNGTISVKDITIEMYYENGTKEEGNVASLEFLFPSGDAWQVEQSVYFKYSSNLPVAGRGALSFTATPLQKNETNILNTSLVLESTNVMTSVREGDTFNIGFLSGVQQDIAIGKLTVVVTKTATDIFAAGVYNGSLTITYTNEA
ncbi:hypothetical protein SpiGrapes_2001 [Sphaerochaeta pleomorpha str. Grapes]|uniref:Uncharacterized protein n=1 Tax=Sphaerochaeta pleomorpha (strain ATCC BAA-1885 / DSM 22778 / Grapes) TaxID=158190 RepID=G8QQE3_SPHPG|nr:hypothetical protein [Sphaerochaeta pleomorpha]AEV29788.1 hypothetical protein SpiGrapes_2001 [Sphaerochaeta pleomorpha str. Grapes]